MLCTTVVYFGSNKLQIIEILKIEWNAQNVINDKVDTNLFFIQNPFAHFCPDTGTDLT